ncbi:MAG TPA: DUF4097 family beta strand repeat-containing protein [Terriglobales bacterium]
MKLQRSGLLLLKSWIAIVICAQAINAMAAAEGTFQRTLKVNGAVGLDIESGSGNITVQRGASGQVQIVGHIRASNWLFNSSNAEERVKRIQENPPIQQNGNEIIVGRISDPELRRNISISYEVTVPVETRVHARTGSGNEEVTGVNGPADLQTGSGNLTVSDVGSTVRAETGSGNINADRIQGSLRARSGSGDIRATGVAGGFDGSAGSGNIDLTQTASGSVRVDTGSGGIDLRGVRGSLEAKAGSGDIHAEGDPTGAWDVHTGSGTVKLRLASSTSFDLYAHTGSGNISVGQPITVQGSLGRKEVRGKVRGGGVSVEVETGSGEIEID